MKRILFVLVTIAAVVLTSCGGLSKMKKNSNTIRYQATPNPMETQDGKVQVKFSGAIPAKYFDKNRQCFIAQLFLKLELRDELHMHSRSS